MYCLLNRLKPLLSQLFPTEIWITSFQSKFTNKTFSKKQRKVCMRWMKWCNNPTHIHTNTEKGIPLQILVGFSKCLPSWSSTVFPCSAPSKSSILFSRGWRCLFSIRQKRFFSSSHKLNPSSTDRDYLPTNHRTILRSSGFWGSAFTENAQPSRYRRRKVWLRCIAASKNCFPIFSRCSQTSICEGQRRGYRWKPSMMDSRVDGLFNIHT